MKDLILGMRYVLRGFKLINTPGLRRFFIVPLLINIMIFAVLIWLGIGQFGALMEWLLPAGPISNSTRITDGCLPSGWDGLF